MRKELLPLGKQTNKTVKRTELRESYFEKNRRKNRKKDSEMLQIRKHHKTKMEVLSMNIDVLQY